MDLNDPNTWRWIWLVVMVVFGIGEIAMAGSFFLAPFALGAAVAAVLAFLDVSITVEWAAFVGISGVSFLALRPLARRMDTNSVTAGIGANRLIGQRARVAEPIGPGHAPGMVLLGGERWRAESSEAIAIDVDVSVVITEVRGTRVVVRPADAPVPSDNGGSDPGARP